jgi:hypothetical protein
MSYRSIRSCPWYRSAHATQATRALFWKTQGMAVARKLAGANVIYHSIRSCPCICHTSYTRSFLEDCHGPTDGRAEAVVLV